MAARGGKSPFEVPIEALSSPGGRRTIANEAQSRLQGCGCPEKPIGHAIRRFVNRLSDARGLAGVGILFEDEGYARPIIDVHILWSSPLNSESHVQSDQVMKINRMHDELSDTLYPEVDTFLEYIHPERDADIDEFQRWLGARAHEGKNARILVCADQALSWPACGETLKSADTPDGSPHQTNGLTMG